MKSHRTARVSEVIREVAANAILFQIKDPRVKNVTVTRAEVSGDLQHAKVFVSVMGTVKEQQLTMHGLKSAAGFLQTQVAERITSRFVPHITFILDDGVKKSVEMARMIREENERLALDRVAAGLPPLETEKVTGEATAVDDDDLEDEFEDDLDDDELEDDEHDAATKKAAPPKPADGTTERPI